MPKQLFQRPSHVNRTRSGKPSHGGQQVDWGRKKKRLDPAGAAKKEAAKTELKNPSSDSKPPEASDPS